MDALIFFLLHYMFAAFLYIIIANFKKNLIAFKNFMQQLIRFVLWNGNKRRAKKFKQAQPNKHNVKKKTI